MLNTDSVFLAVCMERLKELAEQKLAHHPGAFPRFMNGPGKDLLAEIVVRHLPKKLPPPADGLTIFEREQALLIRMEMAAPNIQAAKEDAAAVIGLWAESTAFGMFKPQTSALIRESSPSAPQPPTDSESQQLSMDYQHHRLLRLAGRLLRQMPKALREFQAEGVTRVLVQSHTGLGYLRFLYSGKVSDMLGPDGVPLNLAEAHRRAFDRWAEDAIRQWAEPYELGAVQAIIPAPAPSTSPARPHLTSAAPAPQPAPAQAPRLLRKADLIADLEKEWPSISADIGNQTRNGLKEAAYTALPGKKQGAYDVKAAKQWAQVNLKWTQQTPEAAPPPTRKQATVFDGLVPRAGKR